MKKYFFFLSLLLLLPALSVNGGQVSGTTDNNGRIISPDKPFNRIISLYSAHTENLCSLGAENQIIGISASDDYPSSILDRRRFSYREDVEKFIGARPDLVLVRPMIERSYPEFVKKLEQAGITVLSLQPGSVGELFHYWKTLGILTGRKKQAEKMVTSFQEGLQSITEKVSAIPLESRPKVYFESIHSKMKTFSATSIAMYVLDLAGGANIAKDAIQVRKTNIAAYGKERILKHASEIDIYLAQKGRMNPITIPTIVNEPGFKAIKAVMENRVYLVEESLVSRPTYRILEGVKKLNGIFYPTTQQ
ncbi:MAG: ABC transporter substrate-binding protein [Deltaproteobacteria bacterium]|nr:ABC transporter substrate-binding protein [Deltaproteobacteria bacterium]